jgi:type I restriction enzyme, S subunit
MGVENDIPADWVESTIGRVIVVESGGTPSTKNSSYWGDEISWITPRDLSSFKGVFIERGERSISIQGLENSSAKLLPKNTILFSSRAPIGYVAIAQNETATNQGFKNLICDEVNSHFKYFYYFMKYKANFIERLSSGSTFSEASGSLIKSIELNLPPLLEQKAIAKVLTAFDDKIELLQAQNKTLETMAQTIFKEWFGKYQIGDELPEDWRVGKLGDVAKHVKNNIKPFNSPNKLYHHYSLPAYDNGLRPVHELGSDIKSNKYSVENNSFLVSKLNPFTPRIWTIFNSEDVNICSTEFQVVKPNEDNLFSIVHCLLNSKYFTDNLSQKIKGTSSSHQRVNPEDIFEVDLVIPNKEDLIRFEKLVIPLITKKDINHKNIQSLTKTRDTLLPKLMSGQVRVNNTKQTVDA